MQPEREKTIQEATYRVIEKGLAWLKQADLQKVFRRRRQLGNKDKRLERRLSFNKD